MGRQIIVQPNSLYAEWSTIIDDFISFDNTIDDLIKSRVKEAKVRAEKEVIDTCTNIKVRGRFHKSFDERIKQILVDKRKTGSIKIARKLKLIQ